MAMSTTEPNLTTLTPFARLPLTPGPNGIIVNPVIEFDPLSRAVTVLSWSDIPTPWWVLRAPDLLAGAGLLLSVLFVAQCRRLVRGVRNRGTLRCPTCEYDLSPPPVGTPPARCPECGRSTAAARPGRPVARTAWIAGATALAVAACVIAASSFLRAGTAGTAWPHAHVRTLLPWWPVSRPSEPPPAPTLSWLVLSPGSIWRTLTQDASAAFRMGASASPTAAWLHCAESNQWRNDLHLLDLTTGARRVVSVGQLSVEGFASLSGFTWDYSAAVVATVARVEPDATNSEVGVRISTVSLVDDSVRLRGVGATAAWSLGANSWRIPRVVAGVSPDGSDWRLLTLEGPDAGTLVLPEAGGLTRRPVSGIAGGVGALMSLRTVTLRPDGSLELDNGLSISATGVGTAGPVSSTGDWQTEIAAQGIMLTQGGLRVGIVGAPAGSASAITGATVSPDGRWAAVSIIRTPGGVGTSSGEVLIFDLHSARGTTTGPTENAPQAP